MLTIRQDDLENVFRCCIKGLPNEACGILAGRDGRVKKVYEMTNAEKSPETFFMDAKEQLRAMKEMRSLGLEMLAIYHSHVTSPAYPSAHDVELAFYPEASYVIVSLRTRSRPEARAFKIVGGKIAEEKLRIE